MEIICYHYKLENSHFIVEITEKLYLMKVSIENSMRLGQFSYIFLLRIVLWVIFYVLLPTLLEIEVQQLIAICLTCYIKV